MPGTMPRVGVSGKAGPLLRHFFRGQRQGMAARATTCSVRLRFIFLEHVSHLGKSPMERTCSLSDQMLCSTGRNPSVVEFHIVSPSLVLAPCSRNMNWSITDSEVTEGDPVVTLELKDDSYTRSMWDFSFQALYKVALHSTSLSTTLKITNTDNKPFLFNSALSYFRASISGVSVKGLKGCKTLNKDPARTRGKR